MWHRPSYYIRRSFVEAQYSSQESVWVYNSNSLSKSAVQFPKACFWFALAKSRFTRSDSTPLYSVLNRSDPVTPKTPVTQPWIPGLLFCSSIVTLPITFGVLILLGLVCKTSHNPHHHQHTCCVGNRPLPKMHTTSIIARLTCSLSLLGVRHWGS
jgi:hypothetical protein